MQTHRDGGGRTTMKAAGFQELSDDSTPFLPPSSSHGERSQIREDCSPVIDLCDVRASILAYSTTTIAEIVMLNRNAVLEIRGMGDTGNCDIELNFYFILLHVKWLFLFIPHSFILFWRRGFLRDSYLWLTRICTFEKVNCLLKTVYSI